MIVRTISTVWIAHAIIAATRPLVAQQTIPVVTLPTASTKATGTLGSVLGVREVGGKLLVNDAGRRQLRLFDSTLATSTVVIDSASGTSRSYGRRPAPLIAYLGDSTLLPDYSSRTMLVLDANGVVARALALPTATDIGLVRRGSGIDQRGRLLYLGNVAQSAPGTLPDARSVDSVLILRADFESRRTDTVGRIARPLSKLAAETPDGRGVITIWTIDPLRALDEWAVLSDGSVAFVRGHDYHLDWVRPNGTASSTAKLPFDWKRLEDEDKRRIFDSTRTQLMKAAENGTIADVADRVEVIRKPNAALPPMAGSPPPAGGRVEIAGRGGSTMGGLKLLPPEEVQLELVPDYYPPIRSGAALADLDGNLWILPTTSKQSQQGELVYDMVNPSGALFQRVRVPLGRLIVGFGKNGVVYMVSGDRSNGFALERSRLPSPR